MKKIYVGTSSVCGSVSYFNSQIIGYINIAAEELACFSNVKFTDAETGKVYDYSKKGSVS